jgi:hypothetical protein
VELSTSAHPRLTREGYCGAEKGRDRQCTGNERRRESQSEEEKGKARCDLFGNYAQRTAGHVNRYFQAQALRRRRSIRVARRRGT